MLHMQVSHTIVSDHMYASNYRHMVTPANLDLKRPLVSLIWLLLLSASPPGRSDHPDIDSTSYQNSNKHQLPPPQ